MIGPAFAEDHPPIGTYPAGSSGSSVFIGITVPRTGTYAVQGEDELKGYQLAIEHINSGHELIKKISPKTTKGVLGKELKYGVADSGAKPNEAVQAQQRFISENKAMMITGGTSSAVAVALNKLAQREKVLFVGGISGSNDTTGKDCVRYGFRQNFYGQTAAAAIGPIVVKTFGKNKKAAYLTPDYTYGHTVTKSMQDYLADRGMDHGHQPGLAARRAGLFFLSAQRRQFRRRRADQRQLGPRRRAVDPAGQAVRRARQDEAGGSVPGAVHRPRSRRRSDAGRLCRHRLLVDASRTSIRWPRCSTRRSRRSMATSRSGAPTTPTWSFAMWAEAVENAGSFYPPDVIKSYEAGRKIQSTVGEVYYRKEDHQCVRPVIIVRGKMEKDMKNKEDYYDVVEIVPGEGLMQKPDAFGCNLGDYT